MDINYGNGSFDVFSATSPLRGGVTFFSAHQVLSEKPYPTREWELDFPDHPAAKISVRRTYRSKSGMSGSGKVFSDFFKLEQVPTFRTDTNDPVQRPGKIEDLLVGCWNAGSQPSEVPPRLLVVRSAYMWGGLHLLCDIVTHGQLAYKPSEGEPEQFGSSKLRWREVNEIDAVGRRKIFKYAGYMGHYRPNLARFISADTAAAARKGEYPEPWGRLGIAWDAERQAHVYYDSLGWAIWGGDPATAEKIGPWIRLRRPEADHVFFMKCREEKLRVAVVDAAAGYEYIAECEFGGIDDAVAECLTGIARKRANDARERGQIDDLLAQLRAANVEIDTDDSDESGNCPTGTHEFRCRYNLPAPIKFTALEAHPQFEEMCQNPQFMRVLWHVAAKLKAE